MRTELSTAGTGPARRRAALFVNIVLILVAAAVLIWAFTLVRGPAATLRTGRAGTGVRTVTVQTGPVTATVTADGSLEPVDTAAASFATAGTVSVISVKVGQTVTKGETLAKIDSAPARRALALAEANLDAANDALDRAGDTGSRTTAGHEVILARLAVDDAKAGVAGTRLTAPMAGTVVAVNGTIGGTSAPSVSSSSGPTAASSSPGGFIDLADLTRLQVTAGFAEADATKLKPGQRATIGWNALPDATAGGTVLAVGPGAGTTDTAVTYGVTTSIENLPAGARPGQTVSVTVITGSARNVTSVNSAAVQVAGAQHTVVVEAADGTQSVRQIEVGIEGDDAYEVTSGLVAGEKVVLPGTGTATTSAGRRPGSGGGPAGGFPGGGR